MCIDTCFNGHFIFQNSQRHSRYFEMLRANFSSAKSFTRLRASFRETKHLCHHHPKELLLQLQSFVRENMQAEILRKDRFVAVFGIEAVDFWVFDLRI